MEPLYDVVKCAEVLWNNNMSLILHEMYRFLKLTLRYMESELSGCNTESTWSLSPSSPS